MAHQKNHVTTQQPTCGASSKECILITQAYLQGNGIEKERRKWTMKARGYLNTFIHIHVYTHS